MSLIRDIITANKEAIVDSIFDDELQTKIVTALNENVDIPFISEKTEGKILDAMYDSIEDVVRNAIIDKL